MRVKIKRKRKGKKVDKKVNRPGNGQEILKKATFFNNKEGGFYYITGLRPLSSKRIPLWGWGREGRR
jgi:hypothetical protein